MRLRLEQERISQEYVRKRYNRGSVLEIGSLPQKQRHLHHTLGVVAGARPNTCVNTGYDRTSSFQFSPSRRSTVYSESPGAVLSHTISDVFYNYCRRGGWIL